MSEEPSLDERKRLFVWAYARQSFEHAHKTARFLASATSPLPEDVERILFVGMVVTYARPFTSCRGLDKMIVDVIPKRFLNLHKELLDTRNKEAGHLDALGYEPDNSDFGNINQVRVRIKRGYTEIVVFRTSLPQGEIGELSKLLYEKACYHVERFRAKYIEKSTLRPGEYRLNIDPKDSRSFIKIQDQPTAPATSAA